MNKANKLIVQGTLIASTAGLIASGGGVVKLNSKASLMTMRSYDKLKTKMIQKYESKGVFTVQEWQLFSSILNHEAKNEKFRNMKGVKGKDLMQTLIKKSE